MPGSHVLSTPPADPNVARAHFASKLGFETDAWDLNADLKAGVQGFVLIDARSPDAFAEAHIPGATNFHHHKMTKESVQALPKDKVIVVYCDGVRCNASTHAAVKLSGFGLRVKELSGGLDGWRTEGYAVEATVEPLQVRKR